MAKKSPARAAKQKAPAKKTVKKTTPKKASRQPAPAKRKVSTKKTVKQASLKKTVKKAAPKKVAAAKKTAAKKKATTKKPAVKKAAPKKSVKTTPSPKTPAKKKAAVKSIPAKKKAAAKASIAQPAEPTKPAPPKAAPSKTIAKANLKIRLLGKGKSAKSAAIGFSLDEVKEIVKKSAATEKDGSKKKAAHAKDKAAALEASLKAAKPAKVAPASLADILGFNPSGGAKASYDDPKAVLPKFRKYYRLLLDLRTHLTGQIDQHAEETLKRSSKDDAGDLSSYGQHMADAGTDTFDRDFALSLVANEQEALSEIEAAIQRIKKGVFGMDEITGEPIDKDRLTAVPFTRYSAQTQKELERNRHRVRTQAGLGAEMGDNAGSITDPNADE